MRRLRLSARTCGWPVQAFVTVVAFLNAGCTLVSPGCRNREAKAAIEQEARDSINLWLTTSQQTALPAEASVLLVEPVETSRHDATRACSAKIAVGRVTVPIEYEIIAGDDGQAFYRWDKEEFGKTFIGTSLLSILPDVARHQPSEPPAPNAQSSQPSDGSQGADATSAQPSSENGNPTATTSGDGRVAMNRWHDEVTDKINAQASNFPIEGSGTVSVSFDISALGKILNVQIQQSSGNAGLDQTALLMVKKTGHVRPPPNRRANVFSMKLAFL